MKLVVLHKIMEIQLEFVNIDYFRNADDTSWMDF